MKKILAALLVASFGAGLMAQNYVYDYKASIKRVDPVFQIKSDKAGKHIAASYKVASDTLSGYVILPKCDNCAGPATSLADTFATEGSVAKGYIVRKGDKISKAAKLTAPAGDRAIGAAVPYVLKVPVNGSAAIFGAYYYLQPTNDFTLRTSVKAANKAWMALDYDLPADSVSVSTKNVLKNVTEDNIILGFLGLTNSGVTAGKATVFHTGFGAATGTYDPADLGWCADGAATSCQMVTSITGTLVGYPAYYGMCGKTPMWDVCYDATKVETQGSQEVRKAVICGTWTLKYNKSLTSAYNLASTAEAKEKVITNKLGANLIYQDYANTKSGDKAAK